VGAGGGIGAGEVLDVLSGLVDKSLVVAEEAQGSGASRYGMLEPVRQYARELLEGNGAAAQEARRRHALWCLTLAEEAEPRLRGPASIEWFDRLEAEHDNLRAALSWSLEQGEKELGLRLLAVSYLFWDTRGHQSEWHAWFERAMAASGTAAPRTRAKVFNAAAAVALSQCDFEAAKVYGEEALALWRELEDEEGIVSALTLLGFTAVLSQRADIPVVALLEEAMELRPKLKDHSVIGNLLRLAGEVAGIQDDLGRARALLEEALALFREAEDPYGIGPCLYDLGLVAFTRTDYDKASALLRESLRISWETSHKPITLYSLFGLAGVAAPRGQPARTARLSGAVEAMMKASRFEVAPLARSATKYDDHRADALSRLGEEAFAAAWSEGKAMPLEEAVEYALSEEEVTPTSVPPWEEPPASAQPASLTHREEEVAALVALGFTNRRIARELSISEHTAEKHVRNILKKLGLDSRVQIAARVTERQGPLP
jgi:DNA-binding CsgD family transcriptional regulator/tetratricopeptide (TPR) repeat protein